MPDAEPAAREISHPENVPANTPAEFICGKDGGGRFVHGGAFDHARARQQRADKHCRLVACATHPLLPPLPLLTSPTKLKLVVTREVLTVCNVMFTLPVDFWTDPVNLPSCVAATRT